MKNWTGERLESFVFNETTIEHLHRYALAAEFAAGKRVLDIACGSGYGSNLLANTATQVTGVDIDAATIETAAKTYTKTNITFKTGRADQVPCPDASFELAVSFETLEHLAAHDQVIAEIKRVLIPGGLLVISTPDKKNYSDRTGTKNPYHIKELYREEFEALLKRHFRYVSLYGQRMLTSSVINSATGQQFKQYTGNFEQVQEDNTSEALYHIALASDSPLPELPNSVFNGNSILEKALEEQEKMITGTITYKLGHVLLYPFKLIRGIFKR